ncbi:restriction endonuclease subunit S [Vibrio vulnificus]|uniref:restriction endonuclease subunit S n=1 Tax=Vibrio parahaemolyticus TaxID=670 RepID=UPI0009B6902F|nr:restriction endonuclease subunit S [Vibrio parahaemolyticus]EHS1183336.1 restriction endonuclease subunit S [Vibrio vulnificus]EHK2882191.1 restriction endonuclease subunit S [Vibrio parahaemolyticus]EHK2923745.1 restriction endonuclease subunit S [Vibrio parahaemolyticus]ELA7147812.1 restriction endonuclease subunit S [Vibrio parahaemolyticus]ELB2773810.1 restriction endonuclease subunit S [Vibrio parahaemolyticus]
MTKWKSQQLSNLASITMGSSPKSTAYNDEGIGLPLIQGNADIKNRLTKPRTYTSQITKECAPGGIIMTVRAPVGAIAKSTVKGCIGRGVCAISATKISQDYLYQYLISQESKWKKLEQGSTFSAIGSKDVKQLLIAYPESVKEQAQIAGVLSTVDKKIDLIDQKIAETEKLKTGLMQKLFSEGIGVQDENGEWQPHTEFQASPFGNVPKCWLKVSLENIASVERGKFSARPRNDPKYFGGNIPFVQTGDVVNAQLYVESYSQTLNELGLTVSKIFPTETILITIAANIGDVAITQFPLACPDSLVGIQAKKDMCDSLWLFFFMQTQKSELDSKATKSAQKNINLQVLKPLTVFLPPLEEQEFIAEILLASEKKIALLKQQKTETHQLKKGLMQKLLTGEWRVPVEETEAA